MTCSTHLSPPTASANRARSIHRSFAAAAAPGLFDHPDRALAAMRDLARDVYAEPTDRVARLAGCLRTDAGARFWTEGSMREYVRLVNEILHELERQTVLTETGPARLGVKSSNRRSGRYTLFRLRSRSDGRDTCRRHLPAGLGLSEGPG